MAPNHLLLLLRHAQAENFAPGQGDEGRPLSERGHAQARAVGEFLREHDVAVHHLLCSSAQRTVQTAEDLGLDCAIERSARIYNAGSETIRHAIAEFPEDVHTALVVGHAPGIPTLAHDLADPESSDAEALDQIARRFPPATLVEIELDDNWADFTHGRLASARLDH